MIAYLISTEAEQIHGTAYACAKAGVPHFTTPEELPALLKSERQHGWKLLFVADTLENASRIRLALSKEPA